MNRGSGGSYDPNSFIYPLIMAWIRTAQKKTELLSRRIFRNAEAVSITSFTAKIQLEESKLNFVSILVQF